MTLADGTKGGDEPQSFLSWVEAAENILAGDLWLPRIVYDERPEGWFWRDAASDDGWSGPHTNREAAAKAACEHNGFHPLVEGAKGRAVSR